MFAKIVDCTPNEIYAHVAYLRGTPVCRLADWLSSPDYILKKAFIDSVRQLGSTRTEFGKLGPFTSKLQYGADKFLVCQVLETLRCIQSPDADSTKALKSIEHFMTMDTSGDLESELRITVLEDVCGYTIKDGCKRAVAFYERRRSLESDRTMFPIYLITKTANP